ncbi:MAG: ABC transporter permease [Desulfobacteraceae bacterium]|nr:ABC transporter permease [Desulfobacteraceae bacterium]MBC2755981.1 ABC transporter permease [Desulfobacteraceae bacterium]
MELQLAWRNIWRNPRRTVIIMIAVIIGVWTMVALTSLMRGIVNDMLENGISTLTGDIKLYASGYHNDPSIEYRIDDPNSVISKIAKTLPVDSKYAARVRVNAIASNARHSIGLTLVGIDPDQEKGVSFIGNGVVDGRMISEDDNNAIVIGQALLEKFETRIGRKLILMSQNSQNEIVSKAFKIVGVFRAKLASTEKQFVFVNKHSAQKMLGIGNGISEISVVINDHGKFEQTSQGIAEILKDSDIEVHTWKDLLPMLTAYMEIFNGFIVLWYLVVFVAMAFGIVNTMLMAVFERMREFGLLKALGMKPMLILRSVLIESGIILIMGAIAGNLLAFGSVMMIAATGIDLSALSSGFEYVGMSSVIYPEIFLKDVFLANVVVLILGLAVSTYPAVKASRITPVEAMAHT